MKAPEVALTLAALVERRPGVTRWQRRVFHPVAVAPQVQDREPWSPLRDDGTITLFYAGQAALVLHRKETPAYLENLQGHKPAVYVVLRPDAGEPPWRLALLTLSPWEAQAWMESGENIVEAVPLPVDLRLVLERFVDYHHVEEPFRKRQRRPHFEEGSTPFARPPGWKATGGGEG